MDKVLLKAQQDILQLIGNKRFYNMSTHREKELMGQVDLILNNMLDTKTKTAYKGIENIYKKSNAILKNKNMAKYSNEELKILDFIYNNYMTNIQLSAITLKDNLFNHVYKSRTRAVIQTEQSMTNAILSKVSGDGIPAFTDKVGRNWNLVTYGDMLNRTVTRQVANTAILYSYPEIDLYKVSSHNSTCSICARVEGRVYSRSGESVHYPALADIFGKINPRGSNDLTNTYLNIHPNCKHVIVPYVEQGKTEEDIQSMRKKSSFTENPIDIDPRSQQQKESYERVQSGRNKLNEAYKQFLHIKAVLGTTMPKSFDTFLSHKISNSPKYNSWIAAYNQNKPN